MTLSERRDAFALTFAKWPASVPWVVTEQGRDVLYGVWVIGNDYRNKTQFYGSYPPAFLDRVLALFPDVALNAAGGHLTTLHVFSGSLPEGEYMRCDSVQPAELACSVYDLPTVQPGLFELVIADPPYSAVDSLKYGTPMIDRRRAMAALAQVTVPGGYLCWLDCCWPMHSKKDWLTVGRILVQRSTNHRARVLSIFERVA